MTRSSGVKTAGIKLVLWGQAGTYKTTFASKLPNPLFIDPNGGSRYVNVNREDVSKWEEVQGLLNKVEKGEEDCQTIVLDEFTDTQGLLERWYCAKNGKEGLGDFGHGKGYSGFRGEMGKVLRQLGRLSAAGINIVIITHSIGKTFGNPEGPDYDKYIPTLDKSIWSNLFGFADAVLYFGNKVYAAENESGKAIGIAGDAKIFCSGTALFDAKNRFNMPKSIANGHDSVEALWHYVDGTRALGEGSLRAQLKSDHRYKEDMTDDVKVQLYVHTKQETKTGK